MSSARTRPNFWRAAVAGSLAAFYLAGAGVIAHAAEPGAPERLPAEVRGVVGSGDQLNLQVKAAGGPDRTIKLGEEYSDGWILQALTPTKATLSKDGQTREVGLNPTGALAGAAPTGPATTVDVTGLPDHAAIQAVIDRDPANAALAAGRYPFLTSDEARREFYYTTLILDALSRDPTFLRQVPDARIALFGRAGYDDMLALSAKNMQGAHNQRIADLAATPITGPSSYYVPAGAQQAQIAASLGVDFRGVWQAASDAQGGRTFTLIAATPDAYAAWAAANPGAPPPGPPVTVVRPTPPAPTP